MSFIDHAQLARTDLGPGVGQIEIVGKDSGGEQLHVREVTLAPGASVPLHVHPTHQECIVILEGEVEGHLDGKTRLLSPGHSILAPTRVVHGLSNTSDRPVRVLAVYPTDAVTREWV